MRKSFHPAAPACLFCALGFLFSQACERQTPPQTSGNYAPILSNGAVTQLRAAPALKWVPFQDPAEQAFSMEVPDGWTVKGGMYRLGYFDYRPMVDLKSPDGAINIRYGDEGVPPYSAPDAQHPKEGVSYVLDAQAQITVARFRDGENYARSYAQSRFQTDCTRPRPQPNSPAPFHAASLPQSDVVQESEGQVTYRCEVNSAPMIAFVYAKTLQHKGAIWTVAPLVSVLSPVDQASDAQAIANRFGQSFQVNPAWIQHQADMDRQGLAYARALAQGRMQALSQQVQQFHARMHAMSSQVAGFEGRMQAQAAQVQQFDDALRGVTQTVDPLTGNRHEVWTGAGPGNQYWINNKNQVVNSPFSPGPDFRPLQNK